MESTESIKELIEIEKAKGEDELLGTSSAYIPNVDYKAAPIEMEEEGLIASSSDNNNDTHNFTVSHDSTTSLTFGSQSNASSILPKASTYISKELEGAHGTYEILPKITVEIAKELQSQTGLVISFEAGKEIAEFIGNKGHFGQLRLGKEKSSGRYYGIKEIKGEDKIKESLEEARLQRGLNGLAHLMSLVDAIELEDGKGKSQLYHIMPLAALGNGKELSSYLEQIKDKGFKEALLVHVAKCVLKGFKELHARNIAHLDFKPDNLVVDATGNVLVIDFGCAKELDDKGFVRGRNLGDTRYYSPEREASSFNYPGKANDCYTIGLSLLELAVGMSVKKGNKAGDYLNHPYLQDALPGTYAGLVKGLLEINPDKRLKVEEALSLVLFAKETKPEILSYLREFVQSLQWEQRVKEAKGIQKILTSAQQLPLPHFTGYVHRPIEVKVIERLLSGSSLPIACTGLGGVGKTQLLTYLVHTPEVQARFKSIFWFRAADNETSLNIQYYGLAQELKLIDEKTPLEEAKRTLIQWFENASQPWLIVFDNADNPETLKSYLPKRGGSILLSSRSPNWQEAISLDLLSISEVQEMLAKAMPERVISIEEAKELGERLGYLPLALSQAIAMIRQEGLDIKDYVESFKQKQQELLSADTSLFGKHLPHSMVTLYQLQLEKLKAESPEAIQLLQYSALLAPDAIPIELMKGLLGEGLSIETYQKAQQLLIQYALWQLKEGSIYIHRLMQEVVRISLSQEELNRLFLVLEERCHEEWWRETTVLENEQRKKSLLLHLEALKTWGEKEEALNTTIPFANILFSIGDYYEYQAGRYRIAKSLLEAALVIYEKHYGKEHPQTGNTLGDLGNAYGDLGEYEKQRDLLLRALAIKEKHYGIDHPETGKALTNLSGVYGHLGEYEKQRDYSLRALEINEKHYGKDHPSTGITLTNLGNAYGSLGEYEKARDTLLRALAINEKHYGKDHPETGGTLNNLGNAYGSLGKYEKKRDALLRALAIKEKHYGKDHPETGMTLTNLGNAYGQLEEYEKARDYSLRALAIIEKHYGKDHPNTGTPLTSLGNAYGYLGEYEKQRDTLLRALAIKEKHYGIDHPETGKALTNLSGVYGHLGEYEKQRDYLLRALAITEKHYGKEHPQTGITLNNLGNAYESLGDYEQQKALLIRVLAIKEKHYGADHPQTGITLNNLGNAYESLEDYEQQKALLIRVLAITEKHYGIDHPETGITLMNLGIAYGKLREYEKARDTLLRALAITEKHYGIDHPETGITLMNLGIAYGKLREYEKKRDILLRALAIDEKHYGKDHPQTGKTLTNLGNAYGDLGEHEKKRDILLRALAITEKHYGKDHPQTGKTLTNLGNAYGDLGEHEKARDTLLRTLAIKEKHYGTDHPQTGKTLTNLGNAYGDLGEYEKKRDILLRALAIDEKHYGKEHPQTGITLTNLGIVYGDLGEYEKARGYLLRALEINEKHYGTDHPSTGQTLTHLGVVYFNLKDMENAYAYQKRAYDIFLKFYGLENQWTKYAFQQLQKFVQTELNKYLELSNAAIAKNDLKETIYYYEKIIKLNPSSQFAQHNLGCYYFVQAIVEKDITLGIKAEKCFQEAMRLGHHSGICTDYANFLLFYQRYEEAIVLLKEAIQFKDNEGLSYGPMEQASLPAELRAEVKVQGSIEIKANILAYYLLILAYQKTDQVKEAMDLLPLYSKEVMTMEEAQPLSYALLGYAYKALQLFKEAADCFDKAYQLKDEHALAKQNRDKCLHLAEKLVVEQLTSIKRESISQKDIKDYKQVIGSEDVKGQLATSEHKIEASKEKIKLSANDFKTSLIFSSMDTMNDNRFAVISEKTALLPQAQSQERVEEEDNRCCKGCRIV